MSTPEAVGGEEGAGAGAEASEEEEEASGHHPEAEAGAATRGIKQRRVAELSRRLLQLELLRLLDIRYFDR